MPIRHSYAATLVHDVVALAGQLSSFEMVASLSILALMLVVVDSLRLWRQLSHVLGLSGRLFVLHSRTMYSSLRFEPGKYNLFSMQDDAAHMKLRNKMAAGTQYSGKENESMERTVNAHIARLIGLLQTKYISTAENYRQPFDFIEQDTDMFDFIKITRDYFPITVVMANLPIVVSMSHSRLFRGMLPKESDKFGFGAFIGVANKKVAERFVLGASSHTDMLGSFIRHGLDQEEAQRESLLNIVADSDTSATTIRVIILSLLGNPVAYQKLQHEIDNGIRAGCISSPITRSPPAAIGTSPFGVYHFKKTFGPDAALFLPEHWLAADPEQFARMASVVGLVFSSGKYQCLGKPVAFMKLNKILVELMRRFGFSSARPEHPAHIFNAGIWLIEDFPVRITQREMIM